MAKTILDLPEPARSKALARLGMTEEEFRADIEAKIARQDATGHGWSTKPDNPGWSNDHPTGEVVKE